jgi:hypothetical protein
VGFKLRYVQLEHPAAFGAADSGGIPHHVHRENPQGGPMRFKAGSQMLECGLRVMIHRLILPGQMSSQRLDRKAMR